MYNLTAGSKYDCDKMIVQLPLTMNERMVNIPFYTLTELPETGCCNCIVLVVLELRSLFLESRLESKAKPAKPAKPAIHLTLMHMFEITQTVSVTKKKKNNNFEAKQGNHLVKN